MKSSFRLPFVAFAFVIAATFAGSAEPSSASRERLRTEAPAVNGLPDFRARLFRATTRHLDLLAESPDQAGGLKGKSAAGMTALASYRAYEMSGKQSYRTLALRLADGILAEMRARKFGVLFVKEKEKGDGEEIAGGGPPALGWYASALAYIYHRESRTADLEYVAAVIDRFPWNEQGWWAATIDIHTGEPKQPISKPSPINKNAAMVMAAGITSHYLKELKPEVAIRLRQKAEQCIYRQIIPAQEADGFWHYNLNGRDPKDKDVFGYFMLTTNVLLELQQVTGAYRDDRLNSALKKAGEFARTSIAPITEPNHGSPSRHRATPGTPARFTLAEDLKRALQLGVVLIGTDNYDEGIKIVDAALQHFPFGNRGDDGAHAVYSTALMQALLLANVTPAP